MRENNFVCSYCGVGGYKSPCKLKRSKNHFCSKDCANKFSDKKQLVKCDNCELYVLKSLYKLSKYKNNFCSSECAYKFKSNQVIVKCDNCDGVCQKKLANIKRSKNHFCCIECANNFKIKQIVVECLICKNKFSKSLAKIKTNPRHCCSRKCTNILTKYFKDWSSSRSKLEVEIEKHLGIVMSDLFVDYNNRDIGYELDIFIPTVKLAIELNGVFHYKPIFGELELLKRQKIDNEKKIKCKDLGIELIVIDVSEDNGGKKIQAQRISEVEKIIRDRVNSSCVMM